jgi:hypothetical protein
MAQIIDNMIQEERIRKKIIDLRYLYHPTKTLKLYQRREKNPATPVT